MATPSHQHYEANATVVDNDSHSFADIRNGCDMKASAFSPAQGLLPPDHYHGDSTSPRTDIESSPLLLSTTPVAVAATPAPFALDFMTKNAMLHSQRERQLQQQGLLGGHNSVPLSVALRQQRLKVIDEEMQQLHNKMYELQNCRLQEEKEQHRMMRQAIQDEMDHMQDVFARYQLKSSKTATNHDDYDNHTTKGSDMSVSVANGDDSKGEDDSVVVIRDTQEELDDKEQHLEEDANQVPETVKDSVKSEEAQELLEDTRNETMEDIRNVDSTMGAEQELLVQDKVNTAVEEVEDPICADQQQHQLQNMEASDELQKVYNTITKTAISSKLCDDDFTEEATEASSIDELPEEAEETKGRRASFKSLFFGSRRKNSKGSGSRTNAMKKAFLSQMNQEIAGMREELRDLEMSGGDFTSEAATTTALASHGDSKREKVRTRSKSPTWGSSSAFRNKTSPAPKKARNLSPGR